MPRFQFLFSRAIFSTPTRCAVAFQIMAIMAILAIYVSRLSLSGPSCPLWLKVLPSCRSSRFPSWLDLAVALGLTNFFLSSSFFIPLLPLFLCVSKVLVFLRWAQKLKGRHHCRPNQEGV